MQKAFKQLPQFVSFLFTSFVPQVKGLALGNITMWLIFDWLKMATSKRMGRGERNMGRGGC